MSRFTWCAAVAAVGAVISVSGCGGDVDRTEPTPTVRRSDVRRSEGPAPATSCTDHEHEESLEARVRASRPVRWNKRRVPAASGGTVQARLLGINDFHGRLSEGLRVGSRPVGGAAALASYLRSAALGFEGSSLIIHAGDHVGASPPESALLQDEPAIPARCIASTSIASLPRAGTTSRC